MKIQCQRNIENRVLALFGICGLMKTKELGNAKLQRLVIVL
jgi:hypothetical protein